MLEYIDAIDAQLNNLFSDLRSGITAREDSRAFGAMIEKQITDNWEGICKSTSSEYVPNPGRRTIYDFASRHKGVFYGFDVKTKDLDSSRYSEWGSMRRWESVEVSCKRQGGICGGRVRTQQSS